jgi:hypothetical protein
MKLTRWLHGAACHCYDPDYDAEAAVREDDPRHVGTFGLIRFTHAYRVEAYDPVKGPWRWHCLSCDVYGDWMSYIAADWGGDKHPSNAGYPWPAV